LDEKLPDLLDVLGLLVDDFTVGEEPSFLRTDEEELLFDDDEDEVDGLVVKLPVLPELELDDDVAVLEPLLDVSVLLLVLPLELKLPVRSEVEGLETSVPCLVEVELVVFLLLLPYPVYVVLFLELDQSDPNKDCKRTAVMYPSRNEEL
jgi:hypothetical protein